MSARRESNSRSSSVTVPLAAFSNSPGTKAWTRQARLAAAMRPLMAKAPRMCPKYVVPMERGCARNQRSKAEPFSVASVIEGELIPTAVREVESFLHKKTCEIQGGGTTD